MKNSKGVAAAKNAEGFVQIFDNKLIVTYIKSDSSSSGWASEIVFQNTGDDTITISNVVPFGENDNSIYITGMGPDEPARAWLFRPGRSPVRVILPDNGWESGYSSFTVANDISVCALARRTGSEGGVLHRYSTDLPPRTHVTYKVYADNFKGEWQNGLRLMFRDNYFYDLSSFDNTLYEREDLAWIKESYLIVLFMAWDRQFYDRLTGKYTYADIIKNGIEQFGKIDVAGIWPTWPRIGLDQRNQWDLYRDLPGGTEQLKAFARMSRLSGTKFFMAYNPWDRSTRKEDHYSGMARIISELEADGVVLDTRGSSGIELQAAADTVRKGVVMYSEGMAVPADMPGIISGRVHNAIFFSPELNLNKLIKPDFSIFRVCDVGEDVLHRELAIAFFNGYGVELNMFRPGGRGEEYLKDLDFLAQTTFILRQNNDAFLDYNWTPMVETFLNRVFVNRWKSGDKTVFTVLNMRSEGVNGNLLRVDNTEGRHYVSLWNHENLVPIIENGIAFVKVDAPGWHSSFSGTRKEGSVDCIAELPDLIKSRIIGDSIRISKTGDGILMVWKGNPSYQTTYKEFRILNDTTIRAGDLFGKYDGKIVLQLVENKRLKDENVLVVSTGEPLIVRNIEPSERASFIPADMVLVPGSKLSYNVTFDETIFPYPETSSDSIEVDSFLIDKFPVTNARYYEFMINSGYMPADTARFLKHWVNGTFRQGQDNYPVVYVSYEDMVAYAKWSGKRLPSQFEWQLAAQGNDGRKWPWGDEFHGTYCNNIFNRPTPVNAFPKGQSPYGVLDLVGNVWQMTNEMYFNGTNYFSIIRGGSFYNPESSPWYLQGGPQPLDKIQMLLMVSQGFDRSETVGFRCVKDIDSSSFTDKKPRR
jgi:formylglycine-generating enzyme required for sulfatase activity